MYPKQSDFLEQNTLPGGVLSGAAPTVRRFCRGKDRTDRGAFAHGETVTWEVTVPRAMGCRAVVMRFAPDGGECTDFPLAFSGLCGDRDVYRYRLDTSSVCEPDGGLFFYEFLFLRGDRTLFTDTRDNVSFTLSDRNAGRFRLLIHRADFRTPEWLRGATVYHVFLDRFARGSRPAPLREGAVFDPDWENGVPQYAERPGGEVANNVFFGGDLRGVTEHLDYLAGLGATVLYLSPVFRASSNHRYDTGDYEEIDPFLGGEAAFRELIDAAHRRGMKVILDGVFNHTGDDSRYFNKKGTYPTVGAYQSEDSPWAGWYRFRSFPDGYECWWGIPILPRLNPASDDCRRYFTAPDGIGARWIRAGADGWRLDVADELSDRFLDEFRSVVKAAARESGREAAIIGEVWENAAEKVAYGKRRRYLLGGQLDSVMNYPFRNAVLAFLADGDSAFLREVLISIRATYPDAVCDCLMNLLGTHDTARVLTVLGDRSDWENVSENASLARRRLSPSARADAIRGVMLGSVLQYTVYGFPSLYYGDEAGLEGYRDPFCRMPFPWGREEVTLIDHYRALGELRRTRTCLRGGEFRLLDSPSGTILYLRVASGLGSSCGRLLVAVNAGRAGAEIRLPAGSWTPILTVGVTLSSPLRRLASLPPRSAVVLEK